MDAVASARIDDFRRSQYASLLAVDRAVGTIVDSLDQTGRLSNTLIVYTSDNGMSWGEHRWGTKLVPYEESIHVPFIVRFDPMIGSPRRDEHLVVNIDLAPTFAELASAAAPGVEGQSLVPLFENVRSPWRSEFLLEHMQHSDGGVPTYCGVHAERYVYVRYRTGEEELYDLERDPTELANQVENERYAQTRMQMGERLRHLCDPLPPGYSL
jgi:arylsulfatase A-like enzyme